MFTGGTLIRRFDGFRRLCRHAAVEFGYALDMPDADLLLANRVLAALGGPPAASEVRGRFAGDGLALLLLFLLTQEIPCRIGLLGRSEGELARVKSLVHLLGQAAYPTMSGGAPLQFQEIVRELGSGGAVLRPCFRYDADGEPTELVLEGAAGLLRTAADGGPFTLAILVGKGPGPAPVIAPGGPLHPAVLIVTP